MPRNPNKTPCQVDGCSSWAMRGKTHCRSHSHDKLGKPASGAPHHNLNALKTGRHAHPISPSELAHLAHNLVHEPEHFSQNIHQAIDSILQRQAKPNRWPNPVASMLLLKLLFGQLYPMVADTLFYSTLDAYLRGLTPDKRLSIETLVCQYLLPLEPADRLQRLGEIMDKFNHERLNVPEKQLMGE